MQPVTPPPVKNPIDLIVAKLHVVTNEFFLQSPNILGGIVFVVVAWFAGKLVARGIRKGFHHKGMIDLGGVLASLVFGLIVAAAVMVAWCCQSNANRSPHDAVRALITAA